MRCLECEHELKEVIPKLGGLFWFCPSCGWNTTFKYFRVFERSVYPERKDLVGLELR